MKKVAIVICSVLIVIACKHAVVNPGGGIDNPDDTSNTDQVCFEAEILPFFQSNCAKSGCHDAASASDGYIFDNYNNITSKGIKPGDANDSEVYEVMIENDPDDRMPPPPNAPLTMEQTDLVKLWINQGAKNTVDCGEACDENIFTYSGAVRPILDLHCTGCHGGSFPDAGIDLTTYPGVKTVADDGSLVGAISWTAGFSRMPKGGDKLSDCNISQVTKWVNAGALNN